MENTLENKAKFFAQYWGLNCISNPDFIWRSRETFDAALDVGRGDLSKWVAELKPLSSITDEDAIVCDFTNGKHAKEYFKTFGESEWFDLDYLRSKGYALPWMRLSIEELIEYRWIKLITE